jgi:hypothetical protein
MKERQALQQLAATGQGSPDLPVNNAQDALAVAKTQDEMANMRPIDESIWRHYAKGFGLDPESPPPSKKAFEDMVKAQMFFKTTGTKGTEQNLLTPEEQAAISKSQTEHPERWASDLIPKRPGSPAYKMLAQQALYADQNNMDFDPRQANFSYGADTSKARAAGKMEGDRMVTLQANADVVHKNMEKIGALIDKLAPTGSLPTINNMFLQGARTFSGDTPYAQDASELLTLLEGTKRAQSFVLNNGYAPSKDSDASADAYMSKIILAPANFAGTSKALLFENDTKVKSLKGGTDAARGGAAYTPKGGQVEPPAEAPPAQTEQPKGDWKSDPDILAVKAQVKSGEITLKAGAMKIKALRAQKGI